MEPCVGGSVHPARDRFCIQLYFVVVRKEWCADSPSRRDDGFVWFPGAGPAVAGWAPSCCYTTCVAGKSSGGWRGMMEGLWGCPAPPPRASPCVLAPLVRVPLTLERRGTVWIACVRWWKAREPAAPRPRPGHTPRARFACTRPFRWERKGQGFALALPLDGRSVR